MRPPARRRSRDAGRRTPAASSRSAARWKASVDSAPSLSFSVVVAEPVAAAAGREVVERPVQPVAAEEPVERAPCADAVLGIAGDGERSELGLDERGRVERLLVARARSRLAALAPVVARQPQHRRPASPHSSPSQRSDSRPSWVRSSRPSACRRRSARAGAARCRSVSSSSNQRQSSAALRRRRQRAARRGARAGVAPRGRAGRRRAVRDRARRTRRCAARRRLERATSAVEQPPRGPDDGGDPGGREDLAERPDRAADVVADVGLVEPAAVVAHEVAHPAVAVGGVQEGERAVEDRRPELLVVATRELERDDGEPCDIVDAVAGVAVGMMP